MKNNILVNIVVLLFCFLLNSCFGVFYVDLGNHYAWLEDRLIVKIKEETKNSLFYDILIRPQVLNYAYDDKYIIVYQVYDGSDFYNSNQIEEEKDSLFLQFSKLKKMQYSYWIIDKQMDKVMGPMNKYEFERRCKQTGIPLNWIRKN